MYTNSKILIFMAYIFLINLYVMCCRRLTNEFDVPMKTCGKIAVLATFNILFAGTVIAVMIVPGRWCKTELEKIPKFQVKLGRLDDAEKTMMR